MKQAKVCLWVGLAGTMALAGPARAGTVLVGEERPLPDGQAKEAIIFVAPTGVRMGTLAMGRTLASKNDYLIFRADKQLVWIVQPEKNQYTQLDKKMMAGVTEKLSAAAGMLQAQMAMMPPEQRAQIEGMMKGLGLGGGGQAQTQPLVQKVASGEKIGSWTCDRYATRTPDGKLLQESWVAPTDATTLPAEDAAALRAMGTFCEDLSKGVQDAMKGVMPGLSLPVGGDAFKGLPVRFVSYDAAGKPDSQWELKSIRQETVAADTFDVPPGFSQQNLTPPAMGSGIPGGLFPGTR